MQRAEPSPRALGKRSQAARKRGDRAEEGADLAAAARRGTSTCHLNFRSTVLSDGQVRRRGSSESSDAPAAVGARPHPSDGGALISCRILMLVGASGAAEGRGSMVFAIDRKRGAATSLGRAAPDDEGAGRACFFGRGAT